MKSGKVSETFVQNLLYVLPYWHSMLVRPFKEMLLKEMSLETYYCLQTLKSCGTLTMTELARQLRVPKQQGTKLVENLYKYQFVERVYNENDRRTIHIRLTQKAVLYLDSYYSINTAFLQSLDEKLTEDELRELNHAVETLGSILPKLK